MRQQLHSIVENTLTALREAGTLTLEAMPAFTVEPPKSADHGDFATNAALMLAKPERKKPRDVAEAIVNGLVDPDGVIVEATIAGPGFINFKVADRVVQKVVRDVLAQGDAFGTRAPGHGKKVMVEFVSANPTGPLHLGHARGAFMGDAVARLLAAAGHDVTREFYVNDYGKQMETLGRSIHARYRQLFGDKVELKAGEYPADYVIDIAQVLKDEDGDKWMGEPEAAWLDRCIEIGIRENLKTIKSTLELCDIRFDVWYSEQHLHQTGKVRAVVDAYEKREVTYRAEQALGTEDKKRRDESKAAAFAHKQQGGLFLRTSEHGDEEDRIILRHDDTPTYLTGDLAYHDAKYARGFDRMIDVWGADHAGHVPRIKAGMELLGQDPNKLEFLLVQIVRLMRGGEEVRISKRTGELYELRELVEEVGQDVVRFIFLMRSPNSQFDFDLELALKQSNDNPVFYCQMGHARCVNVLKKAEEKGQPFKGHELLSDDELAHLTLPEERAILKKVAALPDVVQAAAESLEPHRLLYYAQDLIADFHSYFTKYKNTHRIVGEDPEVTQARLAMVAALRQALKNALGLLGITAPDWMEPPKDDEDAT